MKPEAPVEHWPYTAADQASSARIGGFGEHFGLSKKPGTRTFAQVTLSTYKKHCTKALETQTPNLDTGMDNGNIHLGTTGAEYWCSRAKPRRCHHRNVSFEDGTDNYLPAHRLHRNKLTSEVKCQRALGDFGNTRFACVVKGYEKQMLLLVLSIPHQWSAKCGSWSWAERGRSRQV